MTEEEKQVLRGALKYIQRAHDDAEARHDSYGDDYMSGGLYEIMEETEELIRRIEELLK